MDKVITLGVHHIGLTVEDAEQSAGFFTELLDWKIVKRREEYPAVFVSDGQIMLTLWQVQQFPAVGFDKNRNIGLHHLALQVESEESLLALHTKLEQNNIAFEFSPEQLGTGTAKHMMCYGPSGIRLEFIWPG